MTAIFASLALPGALAALGAPATIAVAIGIATALVGVGDVVFGLMLRRGKLVTAGLHGHLAVERGLGALDYLEEPTHDHLSPAAEALTAARDRMLAIGGSSAEGLESVVGALGVVEELEQAIRETRTARTVRRQAGWRRPLGGLALKNGYRAEQDPMTLYQDPLSLPDWINGPRVRDALVRIGSVLDDVRLLHDAQIEWLVLLFTMWSRLLLVGFAPLLGAATLGVVPIADGLAPKDVPWLLAIVCSAATALAAPRLAAAVMRRDARGAEVRRLLLALEVPICIASIIATPCWPVAAFAAGWTNWWQRPTFSWFRLYAWIASVIACLVTGMALLGDPVWRIAAESAISMAVIALIGGSQGAMLPISASMLTQIVAGGLISPARARRRADDQMSSAIKQLFEAARLIENGAALGDMRAASDATSLRDIASSLSAKADTTTSWTRRAPLGLETLLVTALERGGGPHVASAVAPRRSARPSHTARTEPLATLPPSFYADSLALLRLKSRSHARSLSLLVVKIVEEARRYGTGGLQTRCHREDDRIVLRFANAIRPEPVPPGRGTGQQTLKKLIAEVPGAAIDLRGPVDGTFVDLPAAASRFGVQISLSAHLFDEPGFRGAATG